MSTCHLNKNPTKQLRNIALLSYPKCVSDPKPCFDVFRLMAQCFMGVLVDLGPRRYRPIDFGPCRSRPMSGLLDTNVCQDSCLLGHFNFNSVQRALVLEDYAPALRVRGFVSTKKGARSIEEKKEGKNNNNNK